MKTNNFKFSLFFLALALLPQLTRNFILSICYSGILLRHRIFLRHPRSVRAVVCSVSSDLPFNVSSHNSRRFESAFGGRVARQRVRRLLPYTRMERERVVPCECEIECKQIKLFVQFTLPSIFFYVSACVPRIRSQSSSPCCLRTHSKVLFRIHKHQKSRRWPNAEVASVILVFSICHFPLSNCPSDFYKRMRISWKVLLK